MLCYKHGQNREVIQHFESFLACMNDADQFEDQIHFQIEEILIFQETINKMVIELSFLISSSCMNSLQLVQKNCFLVDKFFRILTKIIANNAQIINNIQNIDINFLKLSGCPPNYLADFTFLSNFLFTNLILHTLKLVNHENMAVLEFLVLIQEVDHDFFRSLFQLQQNLITKYIYSILKAQYSSKKINFHIVSHCLLILIVNHDLFINCQDDFHKVNAFFQEFISQKLQVLPFSNSNRSPEFEKIISLHSELNLNILFRAKPSLIINDLFNERMEILNSFVILATNLQNNAVQKIVINFIIRALQSNIDFDFYSFLSNNEFTYKFFYQIYSNFLINPNQCQEVNLFSETDKEIIEILFDLISVISFVVDTIPDSLCSIVINFICNQYYYHSAIQSSSFINDYIIVTLTNLSALTGSVTDCIISIPGFLENVVNRIDDSPFETKCHICVILSNLLFECSQYFDSLMSRINIIGKLKALIWSSTPSLHKEVCQVFLNILMNIEKEESKFEICSELREEGIIESFSMMLSDIDSEEIDDKSYIFELSEIINHYTY